MSTLTETFRKVRHVFDRPLETDTVITLRDAVRVPYGAFKFKCQVPPNQQHIVHASSDLKNWLPIASAVAKQEVVEFVDSDAPKYGCRFYRVTSGSAVSTNTIGFASRTLVPGFSMISNPLRGARQTVAQLFAGWPDGTSLTQFDIINMRLVENAVKKGVWAQPNDQLVPGKGAIFFNPTSDYKAFSFVGEVNPGNLSMPIPAGFSMRGSMLPMPGALADDLKFPIADGDVVHLFDADRQVYQEYPFDKGRWTSGQPTLGVCEAFWIAKDKPGNWIRQLSFL